MAAAFERRSNNSEILITKDFLGGLSSNPEADRNISKTQHASHERCSSLNSPSSSSSSSLWNHQKQTNPDEDFRALNLNYPPSAAAGGGGGGGGKEMNLFEDTCLDLKLQSSSNYQSVCTLDKVKSALQRAEKETAKKRPSPPPQPSSCAMFAAACPGCFLYVITLKTNPKCPRCSSTVPSPLLVKKAKFDLNASI